MYMGTLADDAAIYEESRSYPRISDIPAVQAHYERCRAQEGTSHNLAEMFALAVAPQSKSDREFLMAQRQGRDDQFGDTPWRAAEYRRLAEAAGASISGQVYMPGLARFPGDPEAWVDGLGDVRRVVEARGMGCEGLLNITAPEPANPPEPAPIADDVVYDRACSLIDADPDLAPVAEAKPQEFMERARDSLSRRWDWQRPYLQD